MKLHEWIVACGFKHVVLWCLREDEYMHDVEALCKAVGVRFTPVINRGEPAMVDLVLFRDEDERDCGMPWVRVTCPAAETVVIDMEEKAMAEYVWQLVKQYRKEGRV